MNHLKNRECREKWLLIAFFLGSLLLAAYEIFTLSKGMVHSDSAAKVLFADQQLRKKQYFPDGFCYSTGVFVFGLENIILFFLLLTDDWMLCREMAQFVQTLLLAGCFFCFFTVVFGKEKRWIGCACGFGLFAFPLSEVVCDLYYYQATYTKNVIGLLLMFALAGKVAAEEKKRRWIWELAFAFVVVFNHFGIRNIMLTAVPWIAAVFICSFDLQKRCLKPSRMEKELVGISALSAAAGVLIYHAIEKHVEWTKQTDIVRFVNVEDMMIHIKGWFQAILEIYGVSSRAELLSPEGMVLPFRFLYMGISAWMVPVFWLLFISRIKNKLWKWFVCYSWFSNLIMFYLFISTSAGGESGAYHVLSVYVNNTILVAGLVVFLWESAWIKRAGFFILVTAAALFHIGYLVQYEPVIHQREAADRKIIQYLKENDLQFGYATFWNAYKYTLLTSGEIQVIGYGREPAEPYYWLTSRDWYEPDYWEGRSFILLGDGQQVEGKYYQAAERVDQVGNYTVLVYEQNISDDPILAADIMQEGMECEITSDRLYTENKAYKKDGILVLEENGKQFGPYMQLEGGRYKVCVYGTGLSGLTFAVTAGRGHEEQDVVFQKVTDQAVVYEFSLSSFMTEVEFLSFNNSRKPAAIEQVIISYLKKNKEDMIFYPFDLQHTKAGYGNAKSIVLEEGGKQFGPYIDLEKGDYVVRVYGENLEAADFAVTTDAGQKTVEIGSFYTDEQLAQYQISLPDAVKNLECLVWNHQKEPVTVSRLCIQRLHEKE